MPDSSREKNRILQMDAFDVVSKCALKILRRFAHHKNRQKNYIFASKSIRQARSVIQQAQRACSECVSSLAKGGLENSGGDIGFQRFHDEDDYIKKEEDLNCSPFYNPFNEEPGSKKRARGQSQDGFIYERRHEDSKSDSESQMSQSGGRPPTPHTPATRSDLSQCLAQLKVLQDMSSLYCALDGNDDPPRKESRSRKVSKLPDVVKLSPELLDNVDAVLDEAVTSCQKQAGMISPGCMVYAFPCMGQCCFSEPTCESRREPNKNTTCSHGTPHKSGRITETTTCHTSCHYPQPVVLRPASIRRSRSTNSSQQSSCCVESRVHAPCMKPCCCIHQALCRCVIYPSPTVECPRKAHMCEASDSEGRPRWKQSRRASESDHHFHATGTIVNGVSPGGSQEGSGFHGRNVNETRLPEDTPGETLRFGAFSRQINPAKYANDSADEAQFRQTEAMSDDFKDHRSRHRKKRRDNSVNDEASSGVIVKRERAPKQPWSPQEEESLVETYNMYFASFGWPKVLEQLRELGIHRNRQQCHDKIKTLLRFTYAEKRDTGELRLLVHPACRPRQCLENEDGQPT